MTKVTIDILIRAAKRKWAAEQKAKAEQEKAEQQTAS